MPLQPIDTQKYLPWKESVTVTSVRPNSANVVELYASAGVYKLGEIEAAPSRGVYVRADIRVTIATDGITFTPKPRDTILWKGDTYTVLKVDGSDWQKFWVLDARNLILAADLRQTGTLKRAANTQDDTGKAALNAAQDTTVADNIPCRVQPTDNQTGDVLERKTMPNTARAILGQQLDARAKDKFICDGVTWSVVASRNPERIDELPYLELESVL